MSPFILPPWPPPALSTWLDNVESSGEPPWLIKSLVPLDSIIQVSGPAKVGRKTLTLMQLVRMIASGKDLPTIKLDPSFLGKPQQVLFCEFEGPQVHTARLWRWLDNACEWKASLENVLWAHRYIHVKLTDPQWVDNIRTLVEKAGVKVVVIDTFSRAAGVTSENDTAEINRSFYALDLIRQSTKGGSVLFAHHIRKQGHTDVDEEDIDATVRGSSAFSGAYDHHLGFRAAKTRAALYLLTRSKLDYDRFFKINWNMSEIQQKAACFLEEFDLNLPLPEVLLAQCYDMLESGQVYTPKNLQDLWDVPRAVIDAIAQHLQQGGLLKRTARGIMRCG